MKQKLKTLSVWIVLVAFFVAVFHFADSEKAERFEDFETFLQDVDADMVNEIRIENNQITVSLHSGDKYMTWGFIDIDDELLKKLSDKGVRLHWGKKSDIWKKVMYIGIPVLIFLIVFIWFLKKQGSGTANILSLRKSTARKVEKSQGVGFDAVGGCAEAKALLADVIDFLKNPERWNKAGVRLPRGILLEGPPGCGKTLLARAVAGETDVRFYLLSASEFVEMFVGVGAARVRDLFEAAAKNAPAIIFIDEMDAVGRRRGSGVGAGHDEREQTLNQLLVCLDGFEPNDRVVVIGATNRPDILDKALLRSGRFDRRVRVPHLSGKDRLEVLKIHTRNKKVKEELSLESIADMCEGYSGAELENLVNEAALLAVRRARVANVLAVLEMDDFKKSLKPSWSGEPFFDRLDAVLVESASQLAEPTGKALARLHLRDSIILEGEVLWADASWIKIRHNTGSPLDSHKIESIVPKIQITRMEALEGTEKAGAEDLLPDPWIGRHPDLA